MYHEIMIRIRTVYLFALLLVSSSLITCTSSQTIIRDFSVAQDDLRRIYGEDISANIFRAVTASSYLNLIIELTENGSRPTDSENNRLARSWIAQELDAVSNGRIEVSFLGAHQSVVGKLPGYLGTGPVVMVGGHYDSVAAAPGANDDATGVAAAIELARVMSRYEWPLDIYFCAWNAEEIGLIGSREVAKIFDEWNIDILAYWNIDMLLVENIDAPPDERVLLGCSGGAMNYGMITDYMSITYGKNLIKSVEGTELSAWSRSDHASFLAEGFHSVLFAFESGSSRDSAYHGSSDTWDNPLYNYTVAVDTVASIGASMAYVLSRAHEQPMNKNFSGLVRSGRPYTTYIPITVPTSVVVDGSWSGGGFTLQLISSQGEILKTIAVNETSGDEMILNQTLSEFGIASLSLSRDDDSAARFNFQIQYETDLNMDGILDRHQFWIDDSEFELDDDEDSLSNALETIIGTSSASPDTDSDNLPDYWEYTFGTDPTRFDANDDPDNDRLDNLAEYESGTNPKLADSDGDTMIDSWEVMNGTDPLTHDASLDPDNDSLSNLEEYLAGTFPFSNDSDNDSMPDAYEVMNHLDPTRDDASLDADEDHLTNLEEYLIGTNPQSADSDRDLMPDSFEVEYGLDPLVDDSMQDLDGDGISNLDEYLQGTNPRVDSVMQIIALATALILGITLLAWLVAVRKTE